MQRLRRNVGTEVILQLFPALMLLEEKCLLRPFSKEGLRHASGKSSGMLQKTCEKWSYFLQIKAKLQENLWWNGCTRSF